MKIAFGPFSWQLWPDGLKYESRIHYYFNYELAHYAINLNSDSVFL